MLQVIRKTETGDLSEKQIGTGRFLSRKRKFIEKKAEESQTVQSA